RRFRGFETHELCLLEIASQKQVVGGSITHGYTYSGPVDIVEGFYWRRLTDQIRTLNMHIGFRVDNVDRPLWVDGKKPHVPDILHGQLRHLASSIKLQEFDLNAQDVRDIVSHVDSDTAKLAGRSILLYQQGISQVECR